MGIGDFVDDVLGLAPEIQKVAGIDSLEMLRSFTDQLSGVEQVEVKNPDGSRSIVTRRIPVSAEQRLLNQQVEESITRLMAQAQELTDIGVAAESARFKPIVDAQTEILQNQLQQQQQEMSRQQEEALAERGLSSSTTGAQQRAALASNVARASADISNQGLLLGEQLRSSALSNTLNTFSLASQQQGRTDALQQAALNRGTGIQLSLASQELARQQANLQNAQFNSGLAFQQSQIATQTGLDLLGGGFQAASGGGGSSGLFASLGSALLSDMRVKENISFVGRDRDINFYSYNYLGQEAPHIGVLAQELLDVLPEAVVEEEGLYKVNYEKVMEHLNG